VVVKQPGSYPNKDDKKQHTVNTEKVVAEVDVEAVGDTDGVMPKDVSGIHVYIYIVY